MATTVTLKPNAIDISGSTSGTTTLQASAVAGTTTLTLPAATDTLVGKATTDTLTNKTLTGAAMNGTLGATTPSTASVTTLTTSSTVTHSGGTANGVAYLDGSKVLTTGSALVFDGTNLGLGVTPSAWGTASGQKAFQIGTSGFALSSSGAGSGDGSLTWNGYYNGTNWIYSYTGGAASRFRLNEAGAAWLTAPSGTAGNAISFTQAMTLDASGNLGVGTTSPSDRLHAAAATAAGLSLQATGTGGSTWRILSTDNAASLGGGALGFNNGSYRMVLDSSGNLLVGTTAAQLDGSSKMVVLNSSATVAEFTASSGTATQAVLRSWNTATSGDNLFQTFHTDAGATQRGSITYNRAGGLVAYNTTSDYRAKDISGYVTDSGSVIDSVPVYIGKMKDATQERPMFIAHETPAYAHVGEKDAVDADGNPVYQQMDASALIPVMWAEIQSLRKRLAAANL